MSSRVLRIFKNFLALVAVAFLMAVTLEDPITGIVATVVMVLCSVALSFIIKEEIQ